jgi:hypothetical protein
MNCPVREEDVALYLTGDLELRKTAAMRVHLNCCSECQGRLTDFSRTADLMRAAWGAPAGDDLRLVREGVRTVLSRRRTSSRRMTRWAIAASLACAAALSVWRSEPREQQQAESLPETQLLSPVVPAPFVLPNLRVSKRVRHRNQLPMIEAGLRSVALVTNSSGNSELRLTTADPNVVILLPMGDTAHVN